MDYLKTLTDRQLNGMDIVDITRKHELEALGVRVTKEGRIFVTSQRKARTLRDENRGALTQTNNTRGFPQELKDETVTGDIDKPEEEDLGFDIVDTTIETREEPLLGTSRNTRLRRVVDGEEAPVVPVTSPAELSKAEYPDNKSMPKNQDSSDEYTQDSSDEYTQDSSEEDSYSSSEDEDILERRAKASKGRSQQGRRKKHKEPVVLTDSEGDISSPESSPVSKRRSKHSGKEREKSKKSVPSTSKPVKELPKYLYLDSKDGKGRQVIKSKKIYKAVNAYVLDLLEREKKQWLKEVRKELRKQDVDKNPRKKPPKKEEPMKEEPKKEEVPREEPKKPKAPPHPGRRATPVLKFGNHKLKM